MQKSTKNPKPKKHYWGITNAEPDGQRKIMFEGSYNDCWRHLVENFGQYKLSYIAGELGIKIERIN